MADQMPEDSTSGGTTSQIESDKTRRADEQRQQAENQKQTKELEADKKKREK